MIKTGLDRVYSAKECRTELSRLTVWPGVGVYILWNTMDNRPIYCGTAKHKGRLSGHLHKDDLANGPLGKTRVNPALRAYCLAQPQGWLGVSFENFADELETSRVERAIIAKYGIRKRGGTLFNQRMSG